MNRLIEIVMAALILLAGSSSAILNTNTDFNGGSSRSKKKIAEMGDIMFKALQSVLIEKKQKELIAQAPQDRKLLDSPSQADSTAKKAERQLRGNKLTKKVQTMLKDKFRAKIYNHKHRYAYSRLLHNNGSQQPIFKPVYISQYPRIMTLVSTATNIVNLSENVMEDEDNPGSMDLKDIFSAANHGLRVYREIRNFIDILFYEQAELSLEIDSFFYNCDKILIGKEELLRLLALEKYYDNARKKCDISSPEFRELDNELLYQTNDFLDKIRRFLLGIDNLRNVASFMSFSVEGKPELNKDWDVMSSIEKIQSGKNLTEIILSLKAHLEIMLFGIRDGVNKGRNIRKDVVTILREMYRLIPLKNEGTSRLASLLWATGLIWLFVKNED